MNEKEFFDKVYACWMGKNIGGTLGGPLEGRMELMDIKGYTQSFIEAVENDDLDLQLVNLHCIEQYGGRADVSLLSREWHEPLPRGPLRRKLRFQPPERSRRLPRTDGRSRR